MSPVINLPFFVIFYCKNYNKRRIFYVCKKQKIKKISLLVCGGHEKCHFDMSGYSLLINLHRCTVVHKSCPVFPNPAVSSLSIRFPFCCQAPQAGFRPFSAHNPSFPQSVPGKNRYKPFHLHPAIGSSLKAASGRVTIHTAVLPHRTTF